MKNTIFTKAIAIFFVAFALAFTAPAQENTPQPGAFSVGDKVEAEYIPGSGKWIPGVIVEVINDGYSYKVKLDRYGDGKVTQDIIHFNRVRRAAKSNDEKAESPNSDAAQNEKTSNKLAYGKYGCTSSKYSNGSYEYTPRGSFMITKDGKYTYYGFKEPSRGTFTVDGEGTLSFEKGYLNNGEATPLGKGYPNRFYLVFPTIPDNRWTCGLVEE